MKITKAQIKKIIREEVTKALREDASDDTFQMVDVIVQALGPQQALEELVQAMERSNAQDLLGYVIRMHDLGSSGDEVEDYEEDSDPEDDYNWVGHKAHYNRKDEGLKGGQKKLDKDKDGDIDAKDMAALRSKKKVKKESLNSIRQLIQQELKNL